MCVYCTYLSLLVLCALYLQSYHLCLNLFLLKINPLHLNTLAYYFSALIFKILKRSNSPLLLGSISGQQVISEPGTLVLTWLNHQELKIYDSPIWHISSWGAIYKLTFTFQWVKLHLLKSSEKKFLFKYLTMICVENSVPKSIISLLMVVLFLVLV